MRNKICCKNNKFLNPQHTDQIGHSFKKKLKSLIKPFSKKDMYISHSLFHYDYRNEQNWLS